MKDIKKIITSLNLVYFDYDYEKNLFINDVDYTNENIKKEFFKITYILSKNNILFDVLENNTLIAINKRFSFFDKLFKRVQNKIDNYNNSKANIYLLNNQKKRWAKNIPLFKIDYLKKEIDLTKYDSLVFTSQNAATAVNNINKSWKEIPSYVIGKETAKKVKELGGNLKLIAQKSNNYDFTNELVSTLKNKKVLYIRGNKVTSNICSELIANNISCEEIILYENNYVEPLKKETLPKNSKIIFSSPSTVEYFFKTFNWDYSFKAISIGKTTLKYFPSNIKPILSEKTSLNACIKKAIML
ncbi:MAG: uroporphyrinogen-III synthase [Arcobacter sp.]|uniref:uroporphyrinogen-III synthase n=1 Tax=uncultured Arcobacter sp. TaxID=165434 RepID=UPI000CBCFEEA|nr:uroporphyrinogen-III synthase [uncultured Arcobacter sp.]PLY11417.1 MAG: uroporphyrinogen-III synthase [Arcobacter sp.]